MRSFIAALILFSSSNPIYAQECRCQSVAGSTESVYQTVTASGRHMQLRFEANPLTIDSNLGFLCVDPNAQISVAKLWMPDMGHGSSPTRLVRAGDACTKVERVSFVMEGTWEIRVSLADGDAGTFSLDVAQ